jgi:hypothetical protein
MILLTVDTPDHRASPVSLAGRNPPGQRPPCCRILIRIEPTDSLRRHRSGAKKSWRKCGRSQPLAGTSPASLTARSVSLMISRVRLMLEVVLLTGSTLLAVSPGSPRPGTVKA